MIEKRPLVGTPYQVFVPSDDDHGRYIAEHGLYDPVWQRFLRDVSAGDFVLDIGAHIGLFSLHACARGARVIAMEPAPTNVLCLQRAAEENPVTLWVLNEAASDKTGTLSFTPDGPYGHVAVDTDRADLPRIDVVARRVDDVLSEYGVVPKFVKIDVEGHECAVLDGMKSLLLDEAPTLLCECNGHSLHSFGLTTTDLRRRLEDYGYANFRLDKDLLVPAPSGEMQPDTVVDLICVPQSRIADLGARGPLSHEELLAWIENAKVALNSIPESSRKDSLHHLCRELVRFGLA